MLTTRERLYILRNARETLGRVIQALHDAGYTWLTPQVIVARQQVAEEVERWEEVERERGED